jgi:hypothetical protein
MVKLYEIAIEKFIYMSLCCADPAAPSSVTNVLSSVTLSRKENLAIDIRRVSKRV